MGGKRTWLALGIGGVVLVLILLGLWLVMRALPDSKALETALGKIPLPPGAGSFEIHGTSPYRKFFVTAELPGQTTAEVASFYRTWFEKNGWESRYSADESLEDLLSYHKGQANINVISMGLRDSLHLTVSYRELEYTGDEFSALLSASVNPEAQETYQHVAKAYRALSSYADTGTHKTIAFGESLMAGTFETKYVAPDQLLLVYTDDSQHVLSLSGQTVTFMSDYDDTPEVDKDVERAIAVLRGVTSGVSSTVLELLLGLADQRRLPLLSIELLPEAEADDGTTCLRIRGTDFLGEQTTLWFGKEDHLLRKIETVEDRDNYETTIYAPRANVPIPPADLQFRAPTTP